MLHGIIKEQGYWLDVRDDISEENEYFYMFFYKPLVPNLRYLFIGDDQAHVPLLQMYKLFKKKNIS